MSIAAIVFDFGNVLGFFSHRRAAEQLAAYSATSNADAIHAFLVTGQLEADYESGRLSTNELLDRLRELFGLKGTDEEHGLAIADMFTPNEDACRLVPLLRPRHKLLLLSNTNELHYRHFRAQFAATLDLFDALVVSHEVGLRKPDPGVYRHCERLAGCRPEQCLFIDDLPANVAAARACGWQGALYRRSPDGHGDELRQVLLGAGVVFDGAGRLARPSKPTANEEGARLS
jgi:putative hydrolase of the HAD superfamily